MKIEMGRGDVNALGVKAARSVSDELAEARKRLASGADNDNAHGTEVRDQIAVAQSNIQHGARWTTMGTMPFGLPQLSVTGTRKEAERNGWGLRTLLTRRMHRAYRDALEAGRVMHKADASWRARRAEIYVADLDVSG